MRMEPVFRTEANQNLDEALRLLDLGYHVLPRNPATKHPFCEWKEFQAQAPTPELVESWWRRWPQAQVCITAANIVVIDLDLKMGASGKRSLPNDWPADPDLRMALFSAPTAVSPSGGTHHWFKLPAGKAYKNSAGLLAPGVDVRTTGGIVVCPPSKNYEWMNGDWIDCGPEDLPCLPPAVEWMLDNIYREKPSVEQAKLGAQDLPEGVRDRAFFDLGCHMRRAGFSEPCIAAALLAKNAEQTNPLPEKQVREKAKQAAKYDPDQGTVGVIERWAEQDGLTEPAPQDPGPIPEHLFSIPGTINQLIELTQANAAYPNLPLAFGAALTTLATLTGRQIDFRGLRTNLYLIVLAQTGVGKEAGRRTAKAAIRAGGLHALVKNGIGSGEGLQDGLKKSPVLLALTDEISFLFEGLRRDKSGSRLSIPSELLQLYTSSSDDYPTRMLAGTEGQIISQPHFGVYGTSTPTAFWDAVTPQQVEGGLISRCMVIEAAPRGRRQEPAGLALGGDLLESIKYWATRARTAGNLTQAEVLISPAAMGTDTASVASLEFAGDQFDSLYKAAERKGDGAAMAIWSRAAEIMRKLAMLYTVSADPGARTITNGAAVFAHEFALRHGERLLDRIYNRVHENEFSKKVNKLVQLVKDCGGSIQHGLALQRMNMTKREFDEIIAFVTETGKLVTKPTKRGVRYEIPR